MNTIGKLSILLLCWCGLMQAHYASLSALTIDGRPLQQVAVGIPFMIQLFIEGGANDEKLPTIQGIEQLYPELFGTRSTIRSSKGFMTVDRIYQYKVRSDQEGTLTIGPAIVKVQGGSLEAPAITVRVGKDQLPRQITSPQETMTAAVHASNEHPFVGEKITLTITVQGPEEMNIMNYNISSIEDALLTQKNVTSAVRIINGTRMLVQTVVLECVPKKAGRLVMPAFPLEVQLPRKQKNDLFMQFFGMVSYDHSVLTTNPVVLEVQPLLHQPADAVGHFSLLMATIDKTELHLGEAAVVTLQLVGDHLEDIRPILQVPVELRSYPSTATIVTTKEGAMLRKEFIVQPLQVGRIEIPEQRMIFFDPSKKEYVTLKTKKIMLNVVPQPEGEQQMLQKIEEDRELQHDALHPLLMYRHTVPTMIPFYIFIWLIFIPWLVIGIVFVINYYRRRRQQTKSYIIAQIQRELTIIIESGNYQQLYSLLVNCCSLLMQRSPEEIQLDELYGLMNNESENIKQQWYTFIDRLMRASFASDQSLQRQLADEFQKWLMLLGEK